MSPALAALSALRSRLEQPRVISCACVAVLSPACVAIGVWKAEPETVLAGLAGCVIAPVALAVAVVRGPA